MKCNLIFFIDNLELKVLKGLRSLIWIKRKRGLQE